MSFLRRILGISDQETARSGTSRRASHVTPSRGQRAVEPIRESPPADPDPPPVPKPEEADESESQVDLPDGSESLIAEEAATRTPEPEPAPEIAAEEQAPVPAPELAGVQKRAMPPAPKPILTRQRQALSYGIASDVGLLRNNNEDACFGMQWHSITVDNRPDFGFFVVADGMGGHLDGERAAGIAVQTLAAEMVAKIYVPLLRNFSAGDSPTVLDALIAASEKANKAVIRDVPGGGTTLSAVAIIGNLAYLAHVGDSRVYLIHDNSIEQLTTDHTLVQRLIEMNELSPEEAENYPQKNVLYRAIGQNEDLRMERLVRILPPSSQVMLCTDGLWDMIDDETIKRVTLEAASPQEACDRLVSLANDRGGADNISVLVLKAPGGGSD